MFTIIKYFILTPLKRFPTVFNESLTVSSQMVDTNIANNVQYFVFNQCFYTYIL